MPKDSNSKQQRQSAATETATQLWSLANQMRHSARGFSMRDLITEARAKGVDVSWQDVHDVSARYGRGAETVVPPFITRFLGDYLHDHEPRSVLDPWAGIGSLLLPLVEGTEITAVTGIIRSEHDQQFARAMDASARVDWLLGAPQGLLSSLNDFDLIVSAPPIGMPKVRETVETKDGKVPLTDSETFVIALKAALHLAKDGQAVFLLPNNFFFRTDEGTVNEALARCRLFVNSIIALPSGAFLPLTSTELNIVFISRRETPEVFVGQLAGGQDTRQLLKNLRQRKAGPTSELGRLMPLSDYRGWRALVASEETTRLAERSGLSPVKLSDVVEAVNLAKRKPDKEVAFEDLPNCVYLPTIGTSPAVTAFSDFKVKPQNYIQLVVGSEKAYAEFLAGFFNSPFGRKTRDSLLRGSFIPKVTKESMLDAVVYLAPIDAQRGAMETDREIKELQLRLGQLERELWQRPVDAAKVRRSLASLNKKDSIESWIETLPFPLASVLWRYHATTNVEHKNIHLFNFFEAAAQFLGTLMASAFHSNASFFQSHKQEWFDGGTDSQYSLTRSSLGQWVVRCQRLAKTTRKMLSDGDERQICLDLYKTSDVALVEGITSKGLFSTLEKIGRHRNDWKGHTGIVSAKEHARRLTLLQGELTQFWSVLGPVFENWWLIRPGSNQYAGGIYHYRAEKLMGSRQILKEVEVETSTVMDSTELYFFDPVARQPLPVLHFFRMLPSPESEENACYFYNRLEKEGARWVSYHFEGQAERVVADPALQKIIQEVEGDDA